MPEIDKLIVFNGFHILIALFIYNLIIYNGSLFEYIGRRMFIMETPNLWVFLLNVSVLYLILKNLTFEFGFRAAIKFKV